MNTTTGEHLDGTGTMASHTTPAADQHQRSPAPPPPKDPICCASVVAEPLGDADAADLAALFGALADPVRLRLLNLVAAAGEVCSCDLTEPLGRSQPTISHHTKALAEAGLLIGEKRGRWMWWRIVPERLAAVSDALAL
ncbi:MAG TPA: metalloregulator ArsR/SmtB family transcription factor [Acidimicrobiales bacterium]|jgi:ArsR family transcriptional regulator